MAIAKKLENGNLLVPMRAEGKSGIIGDALVEIDPNHAQYGAWFAYIGKDKKAKLTFNKPK